MIISDTYISPIKTYVQKPLVVEWREICLKADPPPLFCEIPDDLKLKSTSSGTSQFYTYSSLASVPAIR